MNIYYVYVYKHPESLQPFYVGKGHGNRAFVHLKCKPYSTKNKFLLNTIKKIKRKYGEPIVEILCDDLTEVEAYKIERELVAKYGRKLFDTDGILCNISEGGHGNLGHRHSEKAKEKMRKPKSSQTKEKMRLARIGRKLSDEHKKNISIANTGRIIANTENYRKPKSIEFRTKLSLLMRGENSPTAKIWKIQSPSLEIFNVKSLKTFCENNNLTATAIMRSNKDKPVSRGKSKGWRLLDREI